MSHATRWRIRIVRAGRADLWVALGPDRKTLSTTQFALCAYTAWQETIQATAAQWKRGEGRKAFWMFATLVIEEAT